MRIGLLIGGLGQGGAERQLVLLAAGLAQRGHEVELVTYAKEDPPPKGLLRAGVRMHGEAESTRAGKLALVRRWIRVFQPEVLHGSMKKASSVAVLANLLEGRRCRVVATDMSTATYGRHKPALWGALALYRWADAVVTQTEANRRSLELLAPWLRGRVRVIRNGVDAERFSPGDIRPTDGVFRFLSVGTVYRVKNPLRVVQAVEQLVRRGVPPLRLDWYGRPGMERGRVCEAYAAAVARVEAGRLGERIRFHGPRTDIENAYREADALVHVSVQEGVPNAVVEAMAAGLPVVVSRVSDLPLIVAEARNGFVCDETRPEAIADAMQAVMETPAAERAAMGARSRELAVRWFGMDRFVGECEALYRELLDRP